MLHGLLIGSLASWYFTTAPALAQHTAVTLYDLRGHGRSERVTSGYDSETMVGDLEAVTQQIEGPITLVGHSYGAVVALKFALRHPARVSRLALVEAPLPPSAAGNVDRFLAQAPEDMLKSLPAPMRDAIKSGGRAAWRLLKNLNYLARQTSLLSDLSAELDIDNTRLATLSCPVLLAYGSNSACIDVGHRLSAVLPSAELVVLEGGHYLHLDAAEELTRILKDFCCG